MNYLKVSISSLFLICMLPLLAQGAPPGTPIDGGLSALLIAGGAYGARKLYKSRNKKSID